MDGYQVQCPLCVHLGQRLCLVVGVGSQHDVYLHGAHLALDVVVLILAQSIVTPCIGSSVRETIDGILQIHIVRSRLACFDAVLVDVQGLLTLGFVVVSLALQTLSQVYSGLLTESYGAGHDILSTHLGSFHHGACSLVRCAQIDHLYGSCGKPSLLIVGESIVDPSYGEDTVLGHAIGRLAVSSGLEGYAGAVGRCGEAYVIGLVVIACTVLTLYGIIYRQSSIVNAQYGCAHLAHDGEGVDIVVTLHLVGFSCTQESVVGEGVDTIGHTFQSLCDGS